jgi:hypothetical protein
MVVYDIRVYWDLDFVHRLTFCIALRSITFRKQLSFWIVVFFSVLYDIGEWTDSKCPVMPRWIQFRLSHLIFLGHISILSSFPCLVLPSAIFSSRFPPLCSFFSTSYFVIPFCPYGLLSTLLLNTFSLCSSLNVKYQVSHPHKTTQTI